MLGKGLAYGKKVVLLLLRPNGDELERNCK